MPRDDQHRVKAELNEAFAGGLTVADPTSETWAVVATFYSALHYVETYLAKHNIHPQSHKERFEVIMRDARLKDAYPDYKFLYQLSITARYRCTGLPDRPYSRAKPRLEKVKSEVEHAISLG
jgi:hypothetical protein